MDRKQKITRAKETSQGQTTPVVLKIDDGLNREIFFYEKGELQKFSTERYKGHRVRLSEEEWQAAQEFADNENGNA